MVIVLHKTDPCSIPVLYLAPSSLGYSQGDPENKKKKKNNWLCMSGDLQTLSIGFPSSVLGGLWRLGLGWEADLFSWACAEEMYMLLTVSFIDQSLIM